MCSVQITEPEQGLEDLPLEQIEREISELAAQINAATCRWLHLVAEFDRREGQHGFGFQSCSAWLAWNCGIDRRTAREHVRVARRLDELPLVAEAFSRGRLSFSKVRALARVATETDEERLLDLAREATASQLERFCRGYRRAIEPDDGDGRRSESAHDRRYFSHYWDDDGSLVVSGRLSPEDGALLLRALEAGRDQLTDPAEDRRATNADALVALADASLAPDARPRCGGERYQVVVDVGAGALTGAADREGAALRDGPALDPETARRIACDASVVAFSTANGTTLDVGRKTRSIPTPTRRAIEKRDQGCRFPGCANKRFVDGHHIVHWADGGGTERENLVSLCRRHHRLVHEGGYRIEGSGDGELVFVSPDGRRLVPAPLLPEGEWVDVRAGNRQAGLAVDPAGAFPLSAGERVDIGYAVSVFAQAQMPDHEC